MPDRWACCRRRTPTPGTGPFDSPDSARDGKAEQGKAGAHPGEGARRETVRRETTTAATAIATSSTPRATRDGFLSTGAIGRKCTPTTRQIHGAMYSERPHTAITAAPAAATPNSTPTMMPYRRMAPGSLNDEPAGQFRHARTTPTTATTRLSSAPTISGERHVGGGLSCAHPNQDEAKEPSIRAVIAVSRAFTGSSSGQD